MIIIHVKDFLKGLTVYQTGKLVEKTACAVLSYRDKIFSVCTSDIDISVSYRYSDYILVSQGILSETPEFTIGIPYKTIKAFTRGYKGNLLIDESGIRLQSNDMTLPAETSLEGFPLAYIDEHNKPLTNKILMGSQSTLKVANACKAILDKVSKKISSSISYTLAIPQEKSVLFKTCDSSSLYATELPAVITDNPISVGISVDMWGLLIKAIPQESSDAEVYIDTSIPHYVRIGVGDYQIMTMQTEEPVFGVGFDNIWEHFTIKAVVSMEVAVEVSYKDFQDAIKQISKVPLLHNRLNMLLSAKHQLIYMIHPLCGMVTCKAKISGGSDILVAFNAEYLLDMCLIEPKGFTIKLHTVYPIPDTPAECSLDFVHLEVKGDSRYILAGMVTGERDIPDLRGIYASNKA